MLTSLVSDQGELERLEKMTEGDLMKELDEEGKEFFDDAKALSQEELDQLDRVDQDHERKAAAEFETALKDAKQKLTDGKSEGDEEALEQAQEMGEQNEVYLDELERDAARNAGKKWKNPKLVANMSKLAHEMDLHAEGRVFVFFCGLLR